MNWWKPKQSAVQQPPNNGGIHEAFHTLQSHVSSFLHKPQNLFFNGFPTAPPPFWDAFKKVLYPEEVVYRTRLKLRELKHIGTIKDYVIEFTTLMLQIPRMSDDDRLKLTYELQYWAKQEFNLFNSKGRKNLAMSDEEIVKHFCKVPVYYSRFSDDDEVNLMISYKDTMKSFIGFFFSKADAMALVDTPSEFGIPYADSEPLDVAIDYNMANALVKFIPEASEVKNALQVKKKAGLPHKNFSGVPVFESRNMSICQDYLSLTSEGCLDRKRLVFFKKDDLEKSLAKARAASHDQGSNLIDTETHIEVAALEDIIQAMKDSSTSEWNNVVFAYPGQDIETGPSPQ
ncbi:hypothetical protein Adt_40340 [Abeliophyllum distichum]|uniref:Retrotransposon gag domain-containing protein n=1 Tax=Abeliophyllum distichum TaxID=126358 RepID=A0ABD1Q7M8_9LAMI